MELRLEILGWNCAWSFVTGEAIRELVQADSAQPLLIRESSLS